MSDAIRLHVVDKSGATLANEPVSLSALLARHERSVELGNGVRVALDAPAEGPPEGYAEDNDWEEVIRDIATAQQHAAADDKADKTTHKPTVADWSAAAPPTDSSIDYTRLEVLDITPSARKFRPPRLVLHTMTAMLSHTAAARMIVCGGVGPRGVCQNEVYDFSLATASWRRVETRHAAVAGMCAHASAIIGDHLFVVGGFGPSGKEIPRTSLVNEAETHRYLLLAMRKMSSVDDGLSFGLLSFVQQLHVPTGVWSILPTGHHLHVAGHTCTTYKGNIFCFGGVDERMAVIGSLVSIDPRTGAVKVLRRSGAGPKPRFMHSAVVYCDWMIVFGGFGADNAPCGDVWAFNFATELWEEMTTFGGPALAGHGCCLMGSRMIVTGGFSEGLDSDQLEPTSGAYELSLVPIKDAFKWRAVKQVKPLAPLACSPMGNTGCGSSFMQFGGFQKITTKKSDSKKDDRLSKSLSTAHPSDDDDHDTQADDSILKKVSPSFLSILSRFPDKPPKSRSGADESHDSIPSDELPESTKVFLKRQSDFIKTRDIQQTMEERRLNLEIKESADANIYLNEQEIEDILASVDRVIETVAQYDMTTSMPDQTPDKVERGKHLDEVKSLLRQARDVLKSMKRKESAATHVRSKGHRKKEGEKFEDFSAAKPFRRVLVMSLIDEVRDNLHSLSKLNSTLKNFIWDGKEDYIEYTRSCVKGVDAFSRVMGVIRNKYIQARLKVITDDIARRQTNMSRLKNDIERQREATKEKSKIVNHVKRSTSSASKRDFTIVLSAKSSAHWLECAKRAHTSTSSAATSGKALAEPTAAIGEGGTAAAKAPLELAVENAARQAAASIAKIQSAIDTMKEGIPTATPFEVNYQRYVAMEALVTPALARIEGESKRLSVLVPGDDDAAGTTLRADLLKKWEEMANTCRSLCQLVGAAFLTYKAPIVRPGIETKRNSSKKRATSVARADRAGPAHADPKGNLPADIPARCVTPLEATRAQSWRPATVEKFDGPVVASAPPVSTATAVPVRGLVEPISLAVSEAPVTAQAPTSWWNPYGHPSTVSAHETRPASSYDYFSEKRGVMTPALVPHIQTPLLSAAEHTTYAPVCYEAPLEVTRVITTPAMEHPAPVAATAEVPSALPEAPSDKSAVSPLQTTPLITAAPVRDIVVAAAPPPLDAATVTFQHHTAAAATQAEMPPAGLPAASAGQENIIRDYFDFTRRGAASGPVAACPCKFDPERSKERAIFKGRLTPGERSILMNREKNKSW